MKKITVAVMVLIILCSLYACGNKAYEDGYEDGYSDGKSVMQDLIEEKTINSYDDGYYFGFEEGHEEGYEEGYEEGNYDGYYTGATYTCLYFGDIDKAFRSALNGGAWYTFVESYDTFIEDIYSTDEELIEIVWSLVSVVNGTDVSEDEISLVTSVFGRDLFINNGVSLE